MNRSEGPDCRGTKYTLITKVRKVSRCMPNVMGVNDQLPHIFIKPMINPTCDGEECSSFVLVVGVFYFAVNNVGSEFICVYLPI